MRSVVRRGPEATLLSLDNDWPWNTAGSRCCEICGVRREAIKINIGMVEDIEPFGAKLDVELLGAGKVLLQRRGKIPRTGTDKCVSRRHSGGVWAELGDPQQGRPRAGRWQRTQ